MALSLLESSDWPGRTNQSSVTKIFKHDGAADAAGWLTGRKRRSERGDKWTESDRLIDGNTGLHIDKQKTESQGTNPPANIEDKQM